MPIFPREKAVDVAYKIVDVINAYKDAVGIPVTPRKFERIDGIADGVIKVWENPGQSAQINHNNWVMSMTKNGWVYGEVLDEELKVHPAMVDYQYLPELYKVNDIIFLAIVNANRPEPI